LWNLPESPARRSLSSRESNKVFSPPSHHLRALSLLTFIQLRLLSIVSRQELIDSSYSTLICAPVYTNYDGISTQVPVGVDEGLKHQSAFRCDELISILKRQLIDYVGILSDTKLYKLGEALIIAVGAD